MSFALLIEHGDRKIRRQIENVTHASQLRDFVLAQVDLKQGQIDYLDSVFGEYIPLSDIRFLASPLRIRVTSSKITETNLERAVTPPPTIPVQQTTPPKAIKQQVQTPQRIENVISVESDDEVQEVPTPSRKRKADGGDSTPPKRIRTQLTYEDLTSPSSSSISQPTFSSPPRTPHTPQRTPIRTPQTSRTRILRLRATDVAATPDLVFPELNTHIISQILHDGSQWWILTKQSFVFVGNNTTATEVQALSSLRIKQIGISETHKLFLTESGQVFGCGSGVGLGLPNNVPMNSPIHLHALDPYKVHNLSCGTNFSILISHDKRLFGIGVNDQGQLGSTDTSTAVIPREFVLAEQKPEEKPNDLKSSGNVTAVLTSIGYVHVVGRIGGKIKNKLVSFNAKDYSVAREGCLVCTVTSRGSGKNHVFAIGKNTKQRLGISQGSTVKAMYSNVKEGVLMKQVYLGNEYALMKGVLGEEEGLYVYGSFGHYFSDASSGKEEFMWRYMGYFNEKKDVVSRMTVRTIGTCDSEIIVVIDIGNIVRGTPEDVET